MIFLLNSRRESQYEEEVNFLKLHHKQEVTNLRTDLELQRENLVSNLLLLLLL